MDPSRALRSMTLPSSSRPKLLLRRDLCPFYTWGFVTSSFSAGWQAAQLAGALGSVLRRNKGTPCESQVGIKHGIFARGCFQESARDLSSRLCLSPVTPAELHSAKREAHTPHQQGGRLTSRVVFGRAESELEGRHSHWR